MTNIEKLREQFLRDPLPRRLGILAAALGRISSTARNSTDPEGIVNLLEQTSCFIEWTVPETAPAMAAELKQINIIIGMWKKSWVTASRIPQQRTLLAAQTKNWSDKVTKFAGMV
ncbi:MAG: hypothetical protein ACOYYJ_04040 [Chloroflexota bacterium]